MEIRLAASAHGMFDTVLRFLPAGTPVSFGDPGLQSAYAACFPGDTLTLEHKQLRCVRMPCQGGFANLLLAGFDSQAAAPFDALRQLAAKAGAALEDFGAASVLIDRLDALYRSQLKVAQLRQRALITIGLLNLAVTMLFGVLILVLK